MVMTETTSAGAMPVSTLVADAVAWVTPTASLREVARALTEAEVGLLVVGEKKKRVLGVVSERDVVRALATGRDFSTTSAIDIARTQLAWTDSSATVAEVAVEMMDQYIRHVLVEEDGRFVGVVSARDLLGAYAAVDSFQE
jgi:CBS domain-containing protein